MILPIHIVFFFLFLFFFLNSQFGKFKSNFKSLEIMIYLTHYKTNQLSPKTKTKTNRQKKKKKKEDIQKYACLTK